MGLLDEAFGNATPGGNLTKPLMVAIGALLLGRMLSGGGASAPDTSKAGTDAADSPDNGLGGGLGGLIEKLQKAGQGDTVDSWLGNGQNKPIEPGQLGSALGQKTIGDLARQAGVSEQDLLRQLSQVLPGLVDKLTPNGRVPNQREIASLFGQ